MFYIFFIFDSDPDVHCKSGYTYSKTSSRCFKHFPGRFSWTEARERCITNGDLGLASISDSATNELLKSLVTENFAWIGGVRTGNGWGWNDSSSWSYQNWNKGEPNNHGGGENFAEIHSSGYWNDVPLTIPDWKTGGGYICMSTITVVGSEAIDVEKGNLLTTLSSCGPSFEISLDVKISSWKSGYANIIHLSEGGNCCNVGQRIPVVYTYNNNGVKTLYVSSAIGNNGNYGISGKWYIPEIPTNSWFTLEISQFEKEVKFKQLLILYFILHFPGCHSI